MSNRVEYSCLTLLLVAAIGTFVLYEPTRGTQDNNHKQQGTVAPDGAQQSVTYDSQEASRAIGGNKIPHTGLTDAEPLQTQVARGLNQLGMSYLNGTGVERDIDAAFSFFDLAAQQGDASAMNNLGNMYEKGLGADPNREKALELYAKAAQLGDRLARVNLQRLKATKS